MSEPTSMTRDRREKLIDKAINLLRTSGATNYSSGMGSSHSLTAKQVVDAALELEKYVNDPATV